MPPNNGEKRVRSDPNTPETPSAPRRKRLRGAVGETSGGEDGDTNADGLVENAAGERDTNVISDPPTTARRGASARSARASTGGQAAMATAASTSVQANIVTPSRYNLRPRPVLPTPAAQRPATPPKTPVRVTRTTAKTENPATVPRARSKASDRTLSRSRTPVTRARSTSRTPAKPRQGVKRSASEIEDASRPPSCAARKKSTSRAPRTPARSTTRPPKTTTTTPRTPHTAARSTVGTSRSTPAANKSASRPAATVKKVANAPATTPGRKPVPAAAAAVSVQLVTPRPGQGPPRTRAQMRAGGVQLTPMKADPDNRGRTPMRRHVGRTTNRDRASGVAVSAEQTGEQAVREAASDVHALATAATQLQVVRQGQVRELGEDEDEQDEEDEQEGDADQEEREEEEEQEEVPHEERRVRPIRRKKRFTKQTARIISHSTGEQTHGEVLLTFLKRIRLTARSGEERRYDEELYTLLSHRGIKSDIPKEGTIRSSESEMVLGAMRADAGDADAMDLTEKLNEKANYFLVAVNERGIPPPPGTTAQEPFWNSDQYTEESLSTPSPAPSDEEAFKRPTTPNTVASIDTDESDESWEKGSDSAQSSINRQIIPRAFIRRIFEREDKHRMICPKKTRNLGEWGIMRLVGRDYDEDNPLQWLKTIGILPFHYPQNARDNCFALCQDHWRAYKSRAWSFIPCAADIQKIIEHEILDYTTRKFEGRMGRKVPERTVPKLSGKFEMIVIRHEDMLSPYPATDEPERMLDPSDPPPASVPAAKFMPRLWQLPLNPFGAVCSAMGVLNGCMPSPDERTEELEKTVLYIRDLWNQWIVSPDTPVPKGIPKAEPNNITCGGPPVPMPPPPEVSIHDVQELVCEKPVFN